MKMTFKTLLISTIISSLANLHTAKADITLLDDNNNSYKITNAGICTSDNEYSQNELKSIIISDSLAINQNNNFASINEAIQQLSQHKGKSIELIFQKITNIPEKNFLQPLLKNLSNIQKITIKGGSANLIPVLANAINHESAFLNNNASLTLEGIKNTTQKPVDMKSILLPQISEIEATDMGKIYVSNYEGTNIRKITIKGDTLWSDAYNDQNKGLNVFDVHHGGFITVLKLPNSVLELNYQATPWKGSFGGYIGYSGLALHTKEANKNLNLTMTDMVSTFYLVVPDDTQKIEFLSHPKLCYLLRLHTPEGTTRLTSNCYQFATDATNFAYKVRESNIKEIFNKKFDKLNKTSLIPLGEIQENSSQTQEDRIKLINAFNASQTAQKLEKQAIEIKKDQLQIEPQKPQNEAQKPAVPNILINQNINAPLQQIKKAPLNLQDQIQGFNKNLLKKPTPPTTKAQVKESEDIADKLASVIKNRRKDIVGEDEDNDENDETWDD